MNTLASQFIDGIALSLAPNTLSKYSDALAGLSEHFPDPSKVKTADVLAWIEEEKASGVKNITIRSKMGLLMRWFRWMQDTGAISTQPLWHTLPRLPKGRPHKVHFTESQYQRVLNIAGNHLWYLETAVIIGWHTGLRMSDVCLLKRENVSMDDGIIRVVPEKKKRFEQAIEIPVSTELRDHLLKVWNTQPETEWVCAELSLKYRHYRTTLAGMFRKMFDEAGLTSQSFHSLRHGFVTRLINSGVSAIVVSSITGQSLKVIQGYAHVSHDAKRRAMGFDLKKEWTNNAVGF